MRKMWRLIIGTMVVAALMTGCGNSQGADDTQGETDPAQETAATADQEENNAVEACGTVDAQTTKQIFLDFPATINKIYVNVGQEVKKGDKLITLNYDDYKFTIEQKKVELELDKIAADGTSKTSTSTNEKISVLQKKAAIIRKDLAEGTDADIKEQQDIITKANNDLKKKERDLKLQEELVKEGAGAQEDINVLKSDIEDLNNQIASAKDKIANFKKEKNLSLNDIQTQIADLKDSETDNQKAVSTAEDTYAVKQRVSNMEVQRMVDKYTKSNITGNDIINNIDQAVVKSITAVEGNKVGSDGAALMELIDEGSLVIKANVPEEFIKDVKVGSEVDIIPYADRDAKFKGKVTVIQQMAVTDNGEVVIPVIIKATEASPYLRYGYSVDVEIHR